MGAIGAFYDRFPNAGQDRLGYRTVVLIFSCPDVAGWFVDRIILRFWFRLNSSFCKKEPGIYFSRFLEIKKLESF